ncbi:hypothetical protein QWJ26_02950 [Streptomyces sp. CSDS2]|nr:hypothetical protein [Streptomyces sp. CSDS2]MDN3258780.1 hypothetical protein [Streptomyces sp. CSDS2]
MRHLFAALDLAKDRLYGHIKPIKRRTQFLESCRYLRTLYPPTVRTTWARRQVTTDPVPLRMFRSNR